MRTGELDCVHGVGHSAGIHGCDGCCIPLVQQARADAWEVGYKSGIRNTVFPDAYVLDVNPYRQENHATDSD